MAFSPAVTGYPLVYQQCKTVLGRKAGRRLPGDGVTCMTPGATIHQQQTVLPQCPLCGLAIAPGTLTTP